MGKTVRIACKADTFLPFTQIKDFQGELKSRTQDDVEHLITSIERHGFAFPFFVWRQPDGTCSCLDGHGRIMALTQMQREGYEIPELPVVYIDAESENEARTKLIHINVVSGRFTDVGFRDLVKDIPDIDLADYNYPELDLERLDAEMKILAQAQQNIQTDVDVAWEGDFSDVAFGGDSSAFSSSSDSVSSSGQTIINPDAAETPTVVGSAATEYSNESDGKEGDVEDDGIRELVVYCPECGETFIFKYNKDPNKEEGDKDE